MTSDIKTINLGFVNVFLINTGEGYVLIDTGIDQKWPILEAELIKTGCLPDRLKLVVLTHGDIDHAGNCARLQKQYNAKIAMHDGDLEMVKTGMPVKRKVKGLMGKFLVWMGSRMKSELAPFNPDILLQDNEVISIDGLTLRVILTPGHTMGSICVQTSDGHLFVGDTISNRMKPGLSPFIENEEKLHRSIEILKRLNARTVYPGHGRPFPFKRTLSIKC
jgi:hydroxyacylglutathione hydrolase